MLEGCASGLVRHAREVKRYAQKTLLSALNDFDDYVQSIAVEALKWLQDEALLKWCPKTHTYSASNLGNAAAKSGMAVSSPFDELNKILLLARKALVLATLLALVVSDYAYFDWSEEEIVQKNGQSHQEDGPAKPMLPPLDQKFFVDLYSNLCPLQMSVLAMVGIDRAYVETRLQQGRMDNPRDENHARQRLLCVRFINANFTRLSGRSKVDHICKKYSITGQYLKKLQEESVRLEFTVSSVCMYMRWQDLGDFVRPR